ncbi:MAG: DUF6261 family protein [Prevotellaceae bacterium]|jgi:hypothetical protein|nr:DUF6261 family protein [Prevotellaceae bacterium]
MDEIIIIINLKQLNNETHVQFNENIDILIIKYNPSTLGIEQLYTHYKSALNTELGVLDIIRKSDFTGKITVQDKVRADIYRGFTNSVKGMTTHFEIVNREAARRLLDILNHYGNISRKTFDAETAAINDLIRELQNPSPSADISTLGLNSWINKLSEENTIFSQLMMARYNEMAGRPSARMKTARVEVDKFYHAILNQVKNTVLAGVTTPDIDNFIKELNAVIGRFKHILLQEKGEKKAKKNIAPENQPEQDTDDII